MNLDRTLRDSYKHEAVSKQLFDLANIGTRFRHCTIDEIPDGLKYKKIISDWITNLRKYLASGKWLLLYGNFGCGKTAASSILLKETLMLDGSAFMLDQNELVDYKLNADKVPFGSFTLEQVVKDSNLLLLDDVGTSREKDIVVELIEWLCVCRYNSKKSLIVTTNLAPDKGLKRFFTDKVMSMFYENGTLLEIGDEYNWRKELGEKNKELV